MGRSPDYRVQDITIVESGVRQLAMGGSGKSFVDGDADHVLVVDRETAAPEDEPCVNLVGDEIYDSILYVTLESVSDTRDGSRTTDLRAHDGGSTTANVALTTSLEPLTSPLVSDGSGIQSVSAPDAIWSRQISDSSDVLALGTHINRLLSGTADTRDIGVCFQSVSTLLDVVRFQDGFRFLHLLLNLLETHGVRGHFHIRADAHDPESIATVSELFDSVVERRTESGAPELWSPHREPHADDGHPARPGPGSATVGQLPVYTPLFWIVAFLRFGMGDIVTTSLGLATGIGVEASPIAALLLQTNGFVAIYVVKFAVFGLLYLLWRVTPAPYDVGVPLGLCLLGVGVTTWNAGVLLVGLV